ncbi:hypothetical protein CYY_007280 [Polysphondylium violaceum]|uniref:Transmembrane protein n=1 Tax=Polysphondylium violaceum TaxID=133409 RepID=A0A8J4UQZ5_9MYCE|nr:hypothetical protein CYY_007280 [Polysphondylium violaceum]
MNRPQDEFTDDETMNVAIEVGMSFRIVFFFIIFVLNTSQAYFEYLHIKSRGKKINPRFMTFLSISLFPFFRVVGTACNLWEKRNDFGSLSGFWSLWATLFEFFEWNFINCYWCQLLYTFFVNKKIKFENTKRVWIWSWGIAIVLTLWTIAMSILCFAYDNKEKGNTISGIGMIVIIVVIGLLIFTNGCMLVSYMKGNEKKIPKLQETINKTSKLAGILLILIIVQLGLYLIFSVILKTPPKSKLKFLTYLISTLLELSQLVIVMLALGDNSLVNYFLFRRVNEASSSGGATTQIKQSSSGGLNPHGSGTEQHGSTIEINLNSFTSSKEMKSNVDSRASSQMDGLNHSNQPLIKQTLSKGFSIALSSLPFSSSPSSTPRENNQNNSSNGNNNSTNQFNDSISQLNDNSNKNENYDNNNNIILTEKCDIELDLVEEEEKQDQDDKEVKIDIEPDNNDKEKEVKEKSHDQEIHEKTVEKEHQEINIDKIEKSLSNSSSSSIKDIDFEVVEVEPIINENENGINDNQFISESKRSLSSSSSSTSSSSSASVEKEQLDYTADNTPILH